MLPYFILLLHGSVEFLYSQFQQIINIAHLFILAFWSSSQVLKAAIHCYKGGLICPKVRVPLSLSNCIKHNEVDQNLLRHGCFGLGPVTNEHRRQKLDLVRAEDILFIAQSSLGSEREQSSHGLERERSHASASLLNNIYHKYKTVNITVKKTKAIKLTSSN